MKLNQSEGAGRAAGSVCEAAQSEPPARILEILLERILSAQHNLGKTSFKQPELEVGEPRGAV